MLAALIPLLARQLRPVLGFISLFTCHAQGPAGWSWCSCVLSAAGWGLAPENVIQGVSILDQA